MQEQTNLSATETIDRWVSYTPHHREVNILNLLAKKHSIQR